MRSATLVSASGTYEVKSLRFVRSAGWRPDATSAVVFWPSGDLPAVARHPGEAGNLGHEFDLAMVSGLGETETAARLQLGPSGVKVVEWDYAGGARRPALVEVSLVDIRSLWARRSWLSGVFPIGAGSLVFADWAVFLNGVVARALPGLAEAKFTIGPAARESLAELSRGRIVLEFGAGKPLVPEIESVLDETGVSLALSLDNRATLFRVGSDDIAFAPPAERIDEDKIEYQETVKRVPEAIDVVTDTMQVDVPFLFAEPVVVAAAGTGLLEGSVLSLDDALARALPGATPQAARRILGAAVYREAFATRSADSVWADSLRGAGTALAASPLDEETAEAWTRTLSEHAFRSFRPVTGFRLPAVPASPGPSVVTVAEYKAVAASAVELAGLARPPLENGLVQEDGSIGPPLVLVDRVVPRIADAPRFVTRHPPAPQPVTGFDLQLFRDATAWAAEVMRIVEEVGGHAPPAKASSELFPATAVGAQLPVEGIQRSALSHEPRYIQLAWWRLVGLDNLTQAAEFDGRTGILRLRERAIFFAGFLGVDRIEAPPEFERSAGFQAQPGSSVEVKVCTIFRYWMSHHQVGAVLDAMGSTGTTSVQRIRFDRALAAIRGAVAGLAAVQPGIFNLASSARQLMRVRGGASFFPLYFGTGILYGTPCYGFGQPPPAGAVFEPIRGSLANQQEGTGPLNHRVVWRFEKSDPPLNEGTLLGSIPDTDAAGDVDWTGVERPERDEFFARMDAVGPPLRLVCVATKTKRDGDMAARLRFRFGAPESAVPVGQSLVAHLAMRPRVSFVPEAPPGAGGLADNFKELEAAARGVADAIFLSESERVRGENYAVVGIAFPSEGVGGRLLQVQVEMPEDGEYMTYVDTSNPYVGMRGAPAVVRRTAARAPAWSR